MEGEIRQGNNPYKRQDNFVRVHAFLYEHTFKQDLCTAMGNNNDFYISFFMHASIPQIYKKIAL